MKRQEIARIKREYRNHRRGFVQTLWEKTTVQEIKASWQLRQYITPAADRKQLTKKQLASWVLETYDRRKNKELAEDLQEIENFFNAGKVTSINVTIEWKSNRTWGANPTATVEVYGDNYERYSSGSIGGWGYDKESTAFAQAVNQSNAVRKLLLSGRKKLGGINGHRNGQLSGGVGTSCYYDIFAALGYKMEKTASGKMFDAYHITRKK